MIAGVAIIAGLGVATVLTGGLAGIAGAALIGAIIGGGSGAIVGGAMSALSGGSFWDGAADGFLWGVIGGALGGGVGGMLSGPAAGTAGTASTVAGGVFGRGVVDTIVDTGVDMARMTLTGGITLSGFVDSIASNALMEFATAGTAPPGSARTVKNAVDNALDSGDAQALRAAEGSAGNVSGGSAAARASQGSGGSGGTPLLTGNTINTPRLTDGGGGVRQGIDSAGGATTRVGRWMSPEEYNKMIETGNVQESFSGTTHVANPANSNAFNGAVSGSLYVEFDVPTDSLKPTGSGWSKIVGPNSFEGRHSAELGISKPEMPPFSNIRIVGGK